MNYDENYSQTAHHTAFDIDAQANSANSMDLNMQDNYGNTPLHAACEDGRRAARGRPREPDGSRAAAPSALNWVGGRDRRRQCR